MTACDAASYCHPRNMSAFSQSFALFANARKYPERISNGSRANYDMPASECQQVGAFLDQSTPPFAVLNSGSPSQETHHYVLHSLTSASYSTSLPHAHLTAGNSLYATPDISVSVMHPPSERGASGLQELNHSTPLSGKCNGPTTSDKPFISYDNPNGSLSNSDLEMAGMLLLFLVLEHLTPLQHIHVAAWCDNTPAVSWTNKLSASRSPIAGRLT